MKQQTVRKQIADLIREMRRVPECIPPYQYLSRDYINAEETFSIETMPVITIEQNINEFCNKYKVEKSSVFVMTSTVKVPYEDFEEQALTLYCTVAETDIQYLARIETIYRDWLNVLYAPIKPEQWATLFNRINEVLYVARNITADVTVIEKCLNALDSIYRCRNHDSNGAMDDIDMRKKQQSTYRTLTANF